MGVEQKSRVQPVEVMPIRTMRLEERVNLVGSIAANESAALRSEISGTLTEILFEEGQAVNKGDVLARIDTRELEARLDEQRARIALAVSNLERSRSLFESAAVSRQELDNAMAEEAQLRASVALLEVRISKSSIVAPFDGVANGRTVSVGDFLTAETEVTRVDDLSRLKVDIEVPERYLPKLQPGGAFKLRTATLGSEEAVRGEVYFVSSRIDDETRATQVKGYVLEPPPFIKPGMFANVSLVLDVIEEALVVPEMALLGTARGTVVIFPKEVDGGFVAEFVPVKTGLRVPGLVQITPVMGNLKEGDEVVSAGVGGLILFPGIPIRKVEPVVMGEEPERTDRVLNQKD